MIEAMRFGRIEIAYFGPFSYVLAKSKAPDIEPFAVGVTKGSPTYKSVIIAQADGPVKTVADIKGKTMGYGDNASTSSHLIPRAYLPTRACWASRDYKVVHLGTHDAVARAVQTGQVQAGGLSQEIFDRARRQGHDRRQQGQSCWPRAIRSRTIRWSCRATFRPRSRTSSARRSSS